MSLYQVFPTIISGAVTQANMRISAVNGTAFIDFSTANALTRYLGREIEIFDSALRSIKGWVKAAGTGETLDSELMRDPTFDDGTKWVGTGTGWTVAGGKATGISSITSSLYDNTVIPSSGKLCKLVITCDTYTSGSFANRLAGTVSGVIRSSTGVFIDYLVSTSTTIGIGIYPASAVTATFTDISAKQVLTPSITGVTISSAPGGTTYNFASKHASFNYNDTAGYTYRISAFQKMAGNGAWVS